MKNKCFLDRKLNNKGFTLTELIVVIVITSIFLGLIIGIFMSTYQTFGNSTSTLKKNTEVEMIQTYFERMVNIANENNVSINIISAVDEEAKTFNFDIDNDSIIDVELSYDSESLRYKDANLDIEYSYTKTKFYTEYDSANNIIKLQFYYFNSDNNIVNTRLKLFSLLEVCHI